MVARPPRSRELALTVAALVLVHAVAFGVVWRAAGVPDAPAPERVAPGAPPERLLRTAAYNAHVVPTRSTAVLRYRENGTVRARSERVDDPRRGRLRFSTRGEVFSPRERYLLPWGEWTRGHDGWVWTGSPQADGYLAVERGVLYYHDEVDHDATRHANGSVTVRGAYVPLPWDAGISDPLEVTFHLEFEDGRPFLTRLVARGEHSQWTVTQRRGASVERPNPLPPVTFREVVARLVHGVTRL